MIQEVPKSSLVSNVADKSPNMRGQKQIREGMLLTQSNSIFNENVKTPEDSYEGPIQAEVVQS